MAPRKRSGFRKSNKPSMAKAKRMVSKQRKNKAKRNMDTYFLKTKTDVTLTPAQGTTVANYIYRSYTLNPFDPNTALYLDNAEFNLWRLQYDKFRVNTVKITLTPKANVLDQNMAQNDANLTLYGDGLVHTCVDRDGQAPSNIASVARYPSYRKYSVLKKFSRSYSIKYPTGIWLDCQNPELFNSAIELGLGGGITMYAENFLEDKLEIFNEPWASVLVEYNIVFQGKTSNKLVGEYDETGKLTGVCIVGIVDGDNFPMTPHANVSGTLKDDTRTAYTDLSGNKPYVEVPVNTIGQPI